MIRQIPHKCPGCGAMITDRFPLCISCWGRTPSGSKARDAFENPPVLVRVPECLHCDTPALVGEVLCGPCLDEVEENQPDPSDWLMEDTVEPPECDDTCPKCGGDICDCDCREEWRREREERMSEQMAERLAAEQQAKEKAKEK